MTAEDRIIAAALEFNEKSHPNEVARALYHGITHGLLYALMILEEEEERGRE